MARPHLVFDEGHPATSVTKVINGEAGKRAIVDVEGKDFSAGRTLLQAYAGDLECSTKPDKIFQRFGRKFSIRKRQTDQAFDQPRRDFVVSGEVNLFYWCQRRGVAGEPGDSEFAYLKTGISRRATRWVP